jgi:hypothetical protein
VCEPTCENSADSAPFGVLGSTSGRDARTGQFTKGNTARVVSAWRSVQFWEAAAGARTRLRDAAIVDRGFALADAPVTVQAVADGLAQAVLIRDGCFLRLLALDGPLTTSGRRRDVLTAWEGASDRALRHATALGLSRVGRDVGLAAWLAAHAEPAGEAGPADGR